MKVMPAERTRLFVLLALLAIAAVAAYYMYNQQDVTPVPLPKGRTAANVPLPPRDTVAQARGTRQSQPVPTKPEPLKLEVLEQVPDEPQPGRNPFRFGVKPTPPAPPPPPALPPPTPTPPPPPPAPQVPLRLAGVAEVNDRAGKFRAYLVDKTGALFEAIDGTIVDGQYRVIKVERNTATVSFLDGSGQRTLVVGGRLEQ